MNIDKKALKGVVDEIEASRARQKGETELQREALKRAVKNHQLDGKAIRIVLQRRAMGQTKSDEQDYYVHSYELALGAKKDAIEALERNEGVRATAKATGLSTGAVSALKKGVQESSFVNSETGEITETALDTPGEGAGTPEVTSRAGSALATIPTREGESCGPGVPDEGPADSNGTYPERSNEPPQPDACSTGEDGLDIPIFLRRGMVAPSKTPEQLDEREGAAT